MNVVHPHVLAHAMTLSGLHDELVEHLHGLDATLAASIRELEILYHSHYEQLIQNPADNEVVVRAHDIFTRRLRILIEHAKEVRNLPSDKLWRI